MEKSTQSNIGKTRTLFHDECSLRIFDTWVNDVPVDFLSLADCKHHSREELKSLLDELGDPTCEVFIYGAGVGCQYALSDNAENGKLKLRGVSGIIDNYIQGERYGLPIMTFDEFRKKATPNCIIYNSIAKPIGKEIHRQCVEEGFKIVSYFEINQLLDMYFDLPKEMGFDGNGKIFVHGGGFNGDTVNSYTSWFGDCHKHIYVFEPSEINFKACQNALASCERTEIINMGIYNATGKARFRENIKMPDRSYIIGDGSKEIKIVTLDDFLGKDRVDFLCLNVCGSEIEALRGAEAIIKRDKPVLAVNLNRNKTNLIILPQIIKEFRPDYNLYLRHYDVMSNNDTVCYAF